MTRIVLRQCSDPRNHPIHVTRVTRTPYSTEGAPVTRYLCGGDALGDRRIRESDDLIGLVLEIEREAADPLGTAFERVIGVPLDAYPVTGSEPIDAPDDGDTDPNGHHADLAASRYFGGR